MLAYLAYGGLPEDNCEHFPCSIEKLYNENYMAFPIISQIVNYYPFLNVSASAIITITLRNNLFEAFGIKKHLSKFKRLKILA